MAKAVYKDKNFRSFYAHFSKDISQAIMDYVTNEVLKNSRYIFTRRVGGVQFGFCTHCRREYATDENLKPARRTVCKKCKSDCLVKASGASRKHLCDDAYIVYYEKSVVDPSAITARGIYVKRDYRGDYYKVQTEYVPECLYLFMPGKSEMYWNSSYSKDWVKGDKIRSEFSNYSYSFNKVCSLESIKEAVKGTPFQFSTWEHYWSYSFDRDMVQFFDLYTKSPCIEFLTKAGMRYFVSAKLNGDPTYSAINWRGVKAQEVLKLDGQQIRAIREYQGELHPLTLRLQQIVAKDKSKLSLNELQDMANTYDSCFEDLKKVLKHTSLRRANAYIGKQSLVECDQRRPSDAETILRTWRDYIIDCTKLGLDLTDDRILFPRRLHESLQYTLKQVKDKADELLNSKIYKRLSALNQKYCFEQGNLCIRPATNADELIREGKMLDHCVGRYAENYANGKTDLLFVRSKSNPDKPFYTMEIQKDKVVQFRGKANCSMTNEVKTFVEAFTKARLEKRQVRAKVQNRQEVAI